MENVGRVRRAWRAPSVKRCRHAAWPALAALTCAAALVFAVSSKASARRAPTAGAGAPTPAYLDTRRSFAERAADLVSRMTLQEKVEQLSTNNAPAIPRLGVQQYTYWNEGQHGVNVLGANVEDGGVHPGGVRAPIAAATSFPTNFAAAMSWDPELLYAETTAVSDEARGFLDKSLWGTGQNNLSAPDAYGSLTYWAPTVNLDRDPRWGRTDETFGEDPYLAGRLAGAYVDGYQGQTLDGRSMTGYLKVAATAKHFALNNVEDDRLGSSSDADERAIREYYTAQFKRLIEDAHVAGLMTGLNAINGTPATADTYTENELAQRTFGFHGYVTSDCIGVRTIYRSPPSGHGWAPPGWRTDGGGDQATWTDTTTGATVSGRAGGEAWALRAGTALNCLGYENRIKYIEEAIEAGVLSEGVVDTALQRVFAIRMATGEFDPPGRVPYTRIGKDVIQSPAHQALAEKVAANSIVLLKDDAVPGSASKLLPADPARLGKVVILGDLAGTVTLGGYSGHPDLKVSAVDGITAAVKAANPSASVVYDPAGTSTGATTPATLSDQTEADIRSADLVIVFVGTDSHVAAEGHDRATLAMPGNYDSLIDQVTALGNPRTALVIQAAGPVRLDDEQGKVPAILFSGYNGESQGAALADVLFGRQNPSGRLDFTWYSDDAQLPEKSNYALTPSATGGLGRTYRYFTGTPTYPFGYGLSYTTFAFSDLRAGPSAVSANGTVRLDFDVTNTGSTAGATVAQLYVATPFRVPGVELPRKRLEGFAKTRVLRPGETQHMTLTVHVPDLAFWDQDARRSVVYDGRYELQLSADAADVRALRTVDVHGPLRPAVRHVTVQPERLVYDAGDTLDLTARNRWIADDTAQRDAHARADGIVEAVRDDGSFVDLRRAHIRYASSDPAVATVSPAGLVRARRSGVATISATVDGVTGSAPIVVRQLSLAAPATMQPGSTATVTATLPNPGAAPVTDVSIALDTPPGWTATAISPTTFPQVPAGGSVKASWTVTVPADARAGGHQLSALADFQQAGPATATAVSQVAVPFPEPVSAPYRTFASPPDGPAIFGRRGDGFGIVTDGWNVWSGNDEYGAIYLPGAAGPDAGAVVRVDAQQATHAYAKAGIMMRADITAAARSQGYAVVALTPEHGVAFEWDATGNGRLDSDTATGPGTASAPVWLKLTRDGATFTGYYSTDGSNWARVGSATVPGAVADEDVGMFMTSNNPLVTGESDFSGFRVGPSP